VSASRPTLARTVLGRLGIAGLLGLILLASLLHAGVIRLPDHLDPFAPLRVADEPNWLTRFKLSRLETDRPQCLAVLKGSAVTHTPVPDRTSGDGCGFKNVVDVTRSSVTFNSGFKASCPVAVAWAMFETHTLQPAARRHLGREVARVEHFGTYACRNVYHREAGSRSEHATANAIDVAAFVLVDGQQVTVARDWSGDPKRAAFLRAVRDGACGFFDVVLTPDYNEAHRDHFHFDMGRYRSCR
jgi:hypothetical protein